MTNGLITANQFQLAPDTLGAVSRGLQLGGQIQQFRSGQQQQQAQQALNQQASALRQQALGGDQQALSQLAAIAPEQAQQLQQFQLGQSQAQAGVSEERKKSVFEAAAQLSNLPDDSSKLQFLKQRELDLKSQGISTQDTSPLIKLFESGQSKEANLLIDAGVQTGEQLGFLKPKKTQAAQKPTSLQQNLIAAGLEPGTEEFQAAVLKATTKPQTIIGTGETEEVKALAKQRVKRFGDIQEAADQATTLLDNLNQLDAIDVQTGALEPAKASIAAVIEGFGVDASSIANATTAQSFNAISGRLLNDVLNAATGPQTDQDADRARRTIASLGDTPGAAQFKNDSLRSLALRQVEQRDFIADQLDKDKNLSQANKEWREFKRKTPSLSSVVKDSSTGLPLFFFQFKQLAKERRAGISDQQIIEAWRGAHGK